MVDAAASLEQKRGKTFGFSLAFCASTGRTATMFIAKTLNTLPDILATHEGQLVEETKPAILPLVNYHNRKAWYDPGYATRIAEQMRSKAVLAKAAGDASTFVDIAFNNTPFMEAFANLHPEAKFLAIFRRCEGFVRSATIVTGEDMQPAGWPDRQKPLTDREKFIELGRLKPSEDSEFGKVWDEWTGIQRNIWLWSAVNKRLFHFIQDSNTRHKLLFEDLVDEPRKFWEALLGAIGGNSHENVESCAALSAHRTNHRAAYQIGAVADWSKAERRLYEKLALPLEEKIYDR
ncbi:hypothetical protein ACFQ3C_15420 [Seohaeicola saemankumensis]|uniref:Sulfotransferase family protein n=1 Tax=Seohaeicola saemankumensis TaxID=481181 RepID=A0ABW3TH98_9RHOB